MRRGWILLLLASATTLSYAASFDCTKARTLQEKAICASPELSAADDKMASAYKAAIMNAPSSAVELIRDDQRGWLRALPLMCLPGNPREPLERCLNDTYRERISLLEHATDSTGGVLFVQRAATHISLSRKTGPPHDTEDYPAPPSCAGIGKAAWPQSLGTSPEWLAWNQAMAKLANNMDEDTLSGGQCEEVWIAVETVSPSLVSATMGNMVYSGGAHPNHNTISINWLLKDRRELKLGDLFRPGSGWESWMQKDIDLYLHQKLDDENGSYEGHFSIVPGAMAKTLQSIVTDPRHWSIGHDGLSVFFNPYEVACYACTPDPLTIPWAELKPYLSPAFEIPR